MTFLESTFGLQGRTAVVTGGAGTLCGAIAEAFLQAGGKVILWDIRSDALSVKVSHLNEVCSCCGRVDAVQVDLMSESSIQEALAESTRRFGRVDVLVNGAGGNRAKCALTDVKEEDFAFVLKLNLMAGCILPTKHVARYWMENEIRGAILNIASMAAFCPLSGTWAYSAAKAAVMNQTMAHAKELARWGIRVNALAPGFFVADQNRRLLLNEDGSLTQRGRDVIAHTPMQRFGDPNDLAAAAVFLVTAGAGFVSGVTLPVDGAFLCHSI